MSLAFRAGISERDFWGMTAFSIYQAFKASQENLSRLAYRTAVYTRMKREHLPKSENDLIAKARPKTAQRQSIQDQRAMAKFITQVMSKQVH